MIGNVYKKGLTGMDDSDDETHHDKEKFKQVSKSIAMQISRTLEAKPKTKLVIS